ncbi:MAG: nuclear transport factor 2 family protein [Actinomycetota bacterium]|nr:nuclear transport factor 2 family protein [Actinomycetota bacterium]
MNDLHSTIDTHLDAYGEPDAHRREELIAQVWTEDGHLIDPPLDGRGRDGISEMAATIQAHYAGHTFRRTSGVDEHHGFARYEWDLLAPDGTVALSGADVVEIADSGMIRRVVGFLGPIPSRES